MTRATVATTHKPSMTSNTVDEWDWCRNASDMFDMLGDVFSPNSDNDESNESELMKYASNFASRYGSVDECMEDCAPLTCNTRQAQLADRLPTPTLLDCELEDLDWSLDKPKDGAVRIKGHWSCTEDDTLKDLVSNAGPGKWSTIADLMCARGHQRSGKQCRERWHNHLDDKINKKPFSQGEKKFVDKMVQEHGKQWASIAKAMISRTDNQVKNMWNTNYKLLKNNSVQPTIPAIMKQTKLAKRVAKTPNHTKVVIGDKCKFVMATNDELVDVILHNGASKSKKGSLLCEDEDLVTWPGGSLLANGVDLANGVHCNYSQRQKFVISSDPFADRDTVKEGCKRINTLVNQRV